MRVPSVLLFALYADEAIARGDSGSASMPSFDLSLIDKSKMGFNSGKIKPISAADKVPTNNVSSTGSWAYYNQCDPAWAYQELGWCSEYTICTAGCGITFEVYYFPAT